MALPVASIMNKTSINETHISEDTTGDSRNEYIARENRSTNLYDRFSDPNIDLTTLLVSDSSQEDIGNSVSYYHKWSAQTLLIADSPIIMNLRDTINAVPGQTFQEKLNTLNACSCCERHNTNKPKVFHTLVETDSPMTSGECKCQCQCRHLARMICRHTRI